MNGISLLVVLATVGVDVGWESTPSGKLAYTIRIETVLVDKLREGSAIESVVEKEDRAQLRNFRVAVGPKNLQTERQTATSANEAEYGWRPNDAGGVDYYVQIGLERLETLARGVLLECEVDPAVPSIDKIYVFVGNTTLPRELPPNLAKTTAWAHEHGAPGDAHNSNVETVSGTQGSSDASRYGNSNYAPPANTQVNVSDANHAAMINQPNTTGYGPQASKAPTRHNGYADNTIQIPPRNNGAAAFDRNRGYANNQSPYTPRQDVVARPQAPAQPTYAQPAYTQPYPAPQQQARQYIAALQPPPAQAYAAAPTREMTALTEQLTAMQAKLDQVAAAPKEVAAEPAHGEKKEPEEKSSLPFVMTALALFCSIGANAYLGWQAWSYFWRFRSVASDLSRARSNAASASRVVAHG